MLHKFAFAFIFLSLLTLPELFGQHDKLLSHYQDYHFSAADTLRGSLRIERNCFDVLHYDLAFALKLDDQSISGHNEILFEWLAASDKIQLDLFENMVIDSIIHEESPLKFERIGNATFVTVPKFKIGSKNRLSIYYHGIPKQAVNPPWDGGFIWRTDELGNPWIAVSCEGIGASLWWPNKDHLSDEPDSMNINITVPSGLFAVCNGNLVNTTIMDEETCYHWEVGYPINNYNVTFNVGDYVHFSDVYTSETEGNLACDYYVLNENLRKAKVHFKQVNGVLEAFEYYFGPYPFWDDGFALVETPYLGMEHQGAIAYGNGYQRGYQGSMIPKDMDWDYIIVHEAGHEWWGNAVSVKDHADMWIHEGFTTYMEALYVEYHFGRAAVNTYLDLQRPYIGNKQPIVGPKDVNFDDWKVSDHYYKGSMILHSLRTYLNDDKLWFDLLKAVYAEFKYKQTDTEALTTFINEYSKRDLQAFWEQYLFYPGIPTLEYYVQQKGNNLKVKYRMLADVESLVLPIGFGTAENQTIYNCSKDWQEIKISGVTEDNFFVNTKDILVKGKKLWERP